MPHYSVSSNLPLLDKKMEIGRRAEAFRPEGVGGEFLKSRGDGCLIESATVPLPPV
jgi:hypothetical protein